MNDTLTLYRITQVTKKDKHTVRSWWERGLLGPAIVVDGKRSAYVSELLTRGILTEADLFPPAIDNMDALAVFVDIQLALEGNGFDLRTLTRIYTALAPVGHDREWG